MEPGQPIYDGMVAHFGPDVVLADGTLDRAALARIAFREGRVEELNAIAHPLVIARQMELTEEIFQREPHAVVMVESALIFETNYGTVGSSRWQSRFDKIILVTAPEEVKIARFVARSSAGKVVSEEQRAEFEEEARRRLAQQISDEQKAALSDYVLTNGGAVTELEWQVDQLWPILEAAA
jgi:dephospho-CoA kinase